MNLKITLSIGVLLNTTLSVMSLNLTREQAKKRERERESWIEVVGCGRNLPSKHSTLRRRYGGGVNDIFVSQYIGQVTRQVWWCVCASVHWSMMMVGVIKEQRKSLSLTRYSPLF